jgi:hypothetical protein
VGLGLAVLATKVRDVERHIDEPHAAFEGRSARLVRLEHRQDRRRDTAMTPAITFPLASSPAAMRSAETVW